MSWQCWIDVGGTFTDCIGRRPDARLVRHKLLSSPPFGLAGGQPGALGRNTLVRADERQEPLPGAAQCQVDAGDSLILETPGGGGFGPVS